MSKLSFKRPIIFVALLLPLFSGCKKSDEKEKFVFVEYVEVEGTCKEDHANKSGRYYGSLVHWYNEERKTHDRYGSVSTWNPDAEISEDIMERVESPNKYFPPFSVDFETVPEAVFNSLIMHIQGVSSDISDDENKNKPGFQATCLLQVKKRLDHLPETNKSKKGNIN